MGDYFYIGSTTTSLEVRLYNHKKMSEKRPEMKVYKKALEIGWDSITITCVELIKCETTQELFIKENTYIDLSNPFCLNSRTSYNTPEEEKQKEKASNMKWRAKNVEKLREKDKQYKANCPPLTEEEKEKKRVYHTEYMRVRRANIPKKERKQRTEEEINESKMKRAEGQIKRRQNRTEEQKEQQRLRHNELQRTRRHKP